MKRFFLSTVAVLLVLACTEIVPEAADTPLGPAIQQSESGSGGEAIAPELESTTCQSFSKELELVKERLNAGPHTAELEQKHAALNAIVADVCH